MGFVGLRVFENNKNIGTTFDESIEFLDATSLEREKYNITGDKAEVCYTEILKQYKFPKIEGENFMTEAYVWNKIARDGFKFRWFNKPLIVCEYREDGLTKNIKEINKKSPKGRLLFLKECFENEKNIRKRIMQKVWYVGIANEIYTRKEIREQLKIGSIKFYSLLILYKLRCLIKKDV